ncbi:AraC family transcriptional regulator [Saccharothrix tamanrassetensis]|uniref:AraC family transcriptional regulator n=1 Tax=Saccharothrix tamanrassetensis TaxID=1051531 RepID=A0A841CLL3_9PSEU|nr:AraC family transcriptional regulator [Saccharothrix tamanrassetensis]MBB5958441.1 AraC family transcriptional regulator [Saccharothrix tamanrassetensis]
MSDDLRIHRVVARTEEQSSGSLTAETPGMVTILSGVVKFCSSDTAFIAAEGDVFWRCPQRSPRVRYLALSRRGAEFACTSFPAAVLESAAAAGATRSRFPRRNTTATSVLRVLLEITESMPRTADWRVVSSGLRQVLQAALAQDTGTSGGRAVEERFVPVLDYMREHLAEHISVDVLAGLIGYSRFHFVRRFTEAVGDTPHHYLTALRVGVAARYLDADTDDTIAHIGRVCGFPTAAGFTRAFRRHVGVTPSEYRARHGGVA